MDAPFATLGMPTALTAILAVALLGVGGLSAAFVYHWREYGMNTQLIRLAPVVYFAVSGVLCFFAILAYLALI